MLKTHREWGIDHRLITVESVSHCKSVVQCLRAELWPECAKSLCFWRLLWRFVQSDVPPFLRLTLNFKCLMHQIFIRYSFYFGLIVYSVSYASDWRNVHGFRSVHWELLFTTCVGFWIWLSVCFASQTLATTRLTVVYSGMEADFFSLSAFYGCREHCTPAAELSLSCILIRFLAVLISDCSDSLCPLYPSATSFEKWQTRLKHTLIKNRGGLFGFRVNERCWLFREQPRWTFSTVKRL